jgi:hypothetical protein
MIYFSLYDHLCVVLMQAEIRANLYFLTYLFINDNLTCALAVPLFYLQGPLYAMGRPALLDHTAAPVTTMDSL